LARKVVARSATVTAEAASRKRKRDFDEDVDLYGETATEKEINGTVDGTNGTNGTAEPETNGITETEETEWLIFLVGQRGELQVSDPLHADNRFGSSVTWKSSSNATTLQLSHEYYVICPRKRPQRDARQ
jgi:hypothetical protein